MTYFEKQRCTDPGETKINLRQLPGKSAKVAWLQEQIYIRTKGCGWIKFKVAFSSAKDKTIGKLEDLLKRLIQITKEERGRTPPEESPVMESHIRMIPVLGTLAL